ncbi:hypothetical protein [Microbacterium lushaniae]|uniref:SbsA Ig-like domain-containing protein n=1 Tax=Microbacterium lushaniae TaxID=2614639 RepID=A0A5J6L7X7_9MICO|nr:hypothetical protein [Microbacterium lushaniae]QEW04664.1 hypothetical protein F6J85_17285 [Microbacterium lushaniae]
MSTDSRRTRARRRHGRGFAAVFAAVLGALVLVGGVGAAVTVAQGPRVTEVRVDPAAAVAASGSRLIVTTTQSLHEIDPAQVEVSPATPFTVDTSGRSIGVRFGLPLRDDTVYTVRIRDVRGLGAGPAATIEETFRTPASEVFLLQRGSGGDAIYRTGLAGEDSAEVFSHPHIEDYRATASHLLVSVLEDEHSALLVVDAATGDVRRLPLPGEGFVTNLQSADRGERIGYTFSDAALGEDGGLESVLFTASLADGASDTPPTRVALPGGDPSVAEWRFVPDTDSILALTFDGALVLASADGADAAPLGTALGVEGIARGSGQAVVERNEGMVVLDLTDGTEEALPEPADDLGAPGSVVPVPGADAGTIRSYARIGGAGTLLSSSVVHVAADGAVQTLLALDPADALVQTCVSPNGRYAALLISPDAAANPYDRYRLPLPQRLETRVIEIASGAEVAAFGGFALSWCQVPPS